MSITNPIIELLKHIKDVTQPLTLIAFLAVIFFGLGHLVLKAIPEMLRHVREQIRIGDPYLITRQIISSIFWLSVILLCLGFSVQLAIVFHKAEQPRPLPDIVPPPSPVAVVHSTPTPFPDVSPIPPRTPTPHPHEYKLVWFDHFDQHLWEVRRTDTSLNEVRNDQFRSWCVPFDESQYIVFQRRLVAGDEHFKETANWWAAPPYNLPSLSVRWLQIMDDERWYFYEVQRK